MRYPATAALVLVVASSLVLRAQEPPAPKPKLDTLEKRCGYALGFQLGTNLKAQGATDLDLDALTQGMRDAQGGVAPVISEATMQEAMMAYQRALQGKAAKKNKDEGAAFLAKNKTAEGVQVTPSGLQYKVVKEGTGPKPTAADTVTVNYEGKLVDGTVFDSSYRTGHPATFPLNGVIRGWTEGVQLMPTGSTFLFYIPAELGYGEAGFPPSIGPGSVLIFKIELIGISKK